jgi:type IV pilus biogenesis protein CpaD/CtpE
MMLTPRTVIAAAVVALASGCARNPATGVPDVVWAKKVSSTIVYGSVASGNSAISADVPAAQVRACMDGLVKGLGQQGPPADLRAARVLAPMTDELTREMVRLLRETGATFLSVDQNVFRFAVSNTQPHTFNCRTPLGTASFILPSRWSANAGEP